MRGLSDPDEPGRICRSDAVSATFKVVPANVGTPYSLSQPYVEPDVDINYLEVMAYASPHVFYGPGNGLSAKGVACLAMVRCSSGLYSAQPVSVAFFQH